MQNKMTHSPVISQVIQIVKVRCAIVCHMNRVTTESTISHVLSGIEMVPKAFEITANKNKYNAINPAQVMLDQ